MNLLQQEDRARTEAELRQGIREDIIFLLLIIWKKEEQIRLIVLSSFFSRALFRVKLLLGGNLSLSSFKKRSEQRVSKEKKTRGKLTSDVTHYFEFSCTKSQWDFIWFSFFKIWPSCNGGIIFSFPNKGSFVEDRILKVS